MKRTGEQKTTLLLQNPCVTEVQQAVTAKGIGSIIFGFSWIGLLLLFGVIFSTLFTANVVVKKGNIGHGTTLYLAFHGLERLFL